MTAAWKLDAETCLMRGDTPAVLSTAMLQMLATSGLPQSPSNATFQRWLAEMAGSEKLRLVIKGVYLNCLGHRDISPAAAATWIRSRSVVSLAWVLEQAGMTNNFGDTVTCVIPTEPSWPNPQISDRKTAAGTFRFFAMPARLVDEQSGALEDIRDLRFDYPRTTPEKALLDWIYLGASARSRMTRPPLDVAVEAMNQGRLDRLAKRMDIAGRFADWQAERERYLAEPDVRDNTSALLEL